MKSKKPLIIIIASILLLSAAGAGYYFGAKSDLKEHDKNAAEPVRTVKTENEDEEAFSPDEKEEIRREFSLDDVPPYNDSPSIEINSNVPYFTEEEKKPETFEIYGELDSLGRCTLSFACIDRTMMPHEDREPIGNIFPSGWQLVKYDNIEDLFLYNRCHLIGYQLTGQNANERNLITGTRYMNVQGMLPYENMVAQYLQETDNHVLYRVTPVFEGDNLLASGVLMEAYSIEDEGELQFSVYCYNVQPGIKISYDTGDSEPSEDVSADDVSRQHDEAYDSEGNYSDELGLLIPEGTTFVLNENTKRFHKADCKSVYDMLEKNRAYSKLSREELIEEGYIPCGNCKP